MVEITVSHKAEATVSLVPSSMGLFIQIAFDDNPPKWVQITFLRSDLVQLVQDVDDRQACDQAEARYQAEKRRLDGLKASGA